MPSGHIEPFERLAASLEPPYFVLYVLHTPRGEGDAGRYQSPELSMDEFRSLIRRVGRYLAADARFDIWVYSPSERATVVWDRHNQIFAYGPIGRFMNELRALGFTEGKCAVPVPHQHHYRAEFEAQASELLSSVSWSHAPLRPENVQ